MYQLELAGTPREMGQQFGEGLREPAREMVHTRLELAAGVAAELEPARDLQWCLALAQDSVQYLQGAILEEFEGIAQGTALTLAELVIGNGWTDFRDLIKVSGASHNCTSFAVDGSLTADGQTYLAQTWDMNVTAAPYLVVVKRKPSQGPRTVSLTTAGCLSLIGVNEHGIAIGNTNLAPSDAQPGIFYLALIHEALAQRALAEALAVITDSRRMSGHYYYLGGPDGEFRGVETAGRRHAEVALERGRYVHTNHYLRPELLELCTEASASSLGRQALGERLVGELASSVTVTDISQVLSSHEGEQPICRHILPGAEWASLAAAIMCPARREMVVFDGTPCQGQVLTVSP